MGLVGTYTACAEFIRLARRIGLDAVFVNLSFVGSNALAKELGKDGEGVVITQVVPFPGDTGIPLVAEYQRALKAADPEAEFGFVSLEGYMVGRLVVQALAKDGRAGDAGRPARDHQGGGHLRPRRVHALLRPGRQPGLGPGVPHRDPGGRQHQAGRPARGLTPPEPAQGSVTPCPRTARSIIETPGPEAQAASGAPAGSALGIKAKLFLAFCGMAALTAVASAVAWYAFVDIDRSVTRITADSMPAMAASLRLAEKGADIAAAAPSLMASASQEDRRRAQADLDRKAKRARRLDPGPSSHRPRPGQDRRPGRHRGADDGEAPGARRRRRTTPRGQGRARRRRSPISPASHAGFLEKLEPLVDDASFDLVIGSERSDLAGQGGGR